MTQVLKFETVARNAMAALFEGKLGIQLGVDECLYEYTKEGKVVGHCAIGSSLNEATMNAMRSPFVGEGPDMMEQPLSYLWINTISASDEDKPKLAKLQSYHDCLVTSDTPVEVKVEKMRDYLRGVLGTQVITWEEFLKANKEALFDGRLALMHEEYEECSYTYEGSKARCAVGTVLTDDTIMKMDSSAADEDNMKNCPITGDVVAMLEKRGFVAFENDRVRDRIILLQKMHDTLLQNSVLSTSDKRMMFESLLQEVEY